MRLSIEELELALVHTFTIARGSESVARTAIFRLEWNGVQGLGETAPSPRYHESVSSVRAYFAAHPVRGDDIYALQSLLDGIPPAARCGLDVALHDAIGKDLGRPLWRLLGLDPAATPVTSFTIGIDSLGAMLAKVDEVRDHPILKIKLGTLDDLSLIEAIRARYNGSLRIDANEAWSPESAVATLRELARFEIEFCEQPIPAGSPEQLRWIRERVKIPIVADEDARNAADLPRLQGCVDGVNVKLVKCGGIRAALEMIATARALSLRVMLGCMVESAILATAAAQLSPLADWADLDGPFLTRDDPFGGITYERGKIVLPHGPGLGVVERSRSAA